MSSSPQRLIESYVWMEFIFYISVVLSQRAMHRKQGERGAERGYDHPELSLWWFVTLLAVCFEGFMVKTLTHLYIALKFSE